MVNNKKGISNIVSTLLIVLLVIVAVGVVWVAVRGLLDRQSEQFEIHQKCTAIKVKVTAVHCDSNTDLCNVTVNRETGGDPFNGVKVILTDENGATALGNSTGNIEQLGSVIVQNIDISAIGKVEKADVTAFFDIEGKESLCDITSSSYRNIVYHS